MHFVRMFHFIVGCFDVQLGCVIGSMWEFEATLDRTYRGKLAPFGSAVFAKAVCKRKENLGKKEFT